MTEETAFTGMTKVVTKSYGLLNDRGEDNRDQVYEADGLASKEARWIIFQESRFVTVGNDTFIVGIPHTSHFGQIYTVDADIDNVRDGFHDPKEIWIPLHDIVSIVPSPPQD